MRYFIPLLSIIFLLSSCQQTTSRKTDYNVHGIDISHYQSQINWEKVAADGIQFAFVKATEGKTFYDTLFCKNWEGMEKVRLYRGAYHFFRPTINAHRQAENFKEIVEMKPGDLPPVLDVEVTDGASKIEIINGVRTWLYLAEIHYNVKPILYTNQNFYNDYLAGHFDDYPIWIARYSRWLSPNIDTEKDWTFWQYGNKGRIDGIYGDVDFNVFRGNIFELDQMTLRPRTVLSGNKSENTHKTKPVNPPLSLLNF